MARTLAESIAYEKAANARAQAEGYQSAAHKEAHANVKPGIAGIAGGAAQAERDANVRAQAAGFRNAAEQEIDANRRSREAGFTSAVDQEIDANRRAREAGYLNAADYESGLRTRSDAPFLDPRLQPAPVIPEKFALGTANLLKYNPDQPNVPGYDPNWRNDPKYAGGFDVHGNPITGGGVTTGGGISGGPPNPTVPSFGYPGYQDWSRFMPTNFGLAEGGGFHYQPWLMGGAGMGGGAGGFAGPTGYNVGGGTTVTGGTTATGGPGPINPNVWGGTDTTGGGNTVTDASGNQWVMSPGGQWVPADSAHGKGLLGTGRLFGPNFYDTSGAFVGSEGAGGGEAPPGGWGTEAGLADPFGLGAAFDMANIANAPTINSLNPGSVWGSSGPTTASILGTRPGFTPLGNVTPTATTGYTGYKATDPNWQGKTDVFWGEPEVEPTIGNTGFTASQLEGWG